MKHFEVAIIGSGPSGASTAFYLGKQGIPTVIIEKETLPRYKTCGGGFVHRGRKNMPFDISEVIEREFFTVDSYFVNNPNTCYKSSKDQPIITMIMRDAFDNLIVEKAKEFGVTLLENHKLMSVCFNGKSSILKTSKGEISANFIIAADGVLSPTAKMCGWTADTRKLIPALEYEVTVSEEDFERLSKSVRFDIDAVPYGYAWCFPKKNHLSLGVLTTKKGKINLKDYYKTYLQILGLQNMIKEDAHGFQIPIAPRTDGFVKNNVFLIGDAAGFAEPITAEGISNAILSGKYVAEALIESKLNCELAKKNYEEKLKIRLLPELKSGLLLSKFFYNNNPIRNYILNNYGQHFNNIMVDILHGDRPFPTNVRKKLATKIKEKVF
ncbi:MAG: geranylgeranyl reductase family protein [Flavobacteriia bacterium]|nr:geranylgeranyl reductase family protein [Flavobacteriia bacterium]OIP48751.1 MAG: geranylgeranyl reductase [Flavobacteriaceae bacterium CG2_30_31_66]PIV95471.1 MAG: geranylgeranyl reductase [Flavobacteriaceae bacterium CG17_big_fil_post_rev_8_21_14_2_50_31_13]PIX12813.1 MAG: geranylgeranyl reductase [Flavobacteriaceae bacterium CG_4_8_14_3_um_filter_31_8]PIY14180.1 MAG: geranylgeranyl reductase [Flavobacteriaceae bacterium CG_4_10_14_3_um_filter_31_253]PIZ10289.1 MAG: geranylgeranyl reducta